MTKYNYFDQNGNYINVENLSLAEIYARASAEGYKRGYTDAKIEDAKAAEEAVRESHYLDDRDGTIAGRAHE